MYIWLNFAIITINYLTNSYIYAELFMSEVSTGSRRSNGSRELRGIIKKYDNAEEETRSCTSIRARNDKLKNRVQFSEENIVILIPRPSTPIYEMIYKDCCYYCCFGYLFPNVRWNKTFNGKPNWSYFCIQGEASRKWKIILLVLLIFRNQDRIHHSRHLSLQASLLTW